LQHAHSCVKVPSSQEGGVRAEDALTACSEYTLLLLVLLRVLLYVIIAVTKVIRAIRSSRIISVFTDTLVIRSIRIKRVGYWGY
jgi:hypothetical protein